MKTKKQEMNKEEVKEEHMCACGNPACGCGSCH